jgi:hypothetical protein
MSSVVVRRHARHPRPSRGVEGERQGLAPIIVDLGKKRRKAIKALMRGDGRLLDEVEQVIGEIRAELGKDAEAAEIVPIVLVYRRKTRRRRGGLAGLL